MSTRVILAPNPFTILQKFHKPHTCPCFFENRFLSFFWLQLGVDLTAMSLKKLPIFRESSSPAQCRWLPETVTDHEQCLWNCARTVRISSLWAMLLWFRCRPFTRFSRRSGKLRVQRLWRWEDRISMNLNSSGELIFIFSLHALTCFLLFAHMFTCVVDWARYCGFCESIFAWFGETRWLSVTLMRSNLCWYEPELTRQYSVCFYFKCTVFSFMYMAQDHSHFIFLQTQIASVSAKSHEL